MKKKTEKSFDDFCETMAKAAKAANSQITMVNMRNCKKYDGGHLFIMFCSKNFNKFDAVESFIDALKDDDE